MSDIQDRVNSIMTMMQELQNDLDRLITENSELEDKVIEQEHWVDIAESMIGFDAMTEHYSEEQKKKEAQPACLSCGTTGYHGICDLCIPF